MEGRERKSEKEGKIIYYMQYIIYYDGILFLDLFILRLEEI